MAEGDYSSFFRTPENFTTLLQSVAKNPQSALLDHVSQQAVKDLVRHEENTSKRDITMRGYLSSREQSLLEATYPQYRFEYKPVSLQGHGLADARRTVEEFEAFTKFGKQSKVVDIGGNYARHICKGFANVHSCVPHLDWRDVARSRKRDGVIRRYFAYASTLNELQRHAITLDNMHEHYCRNKGQDCKVKADVTMFLHSGYDIDFHSLATIAKGHGSPEFYGTLIFDPMVLTHDEGFIESVGMFFKKEKRFVSKHTHAGLTWSEIVATHGMLAAPVQALLGYELKLCIVFMFKGDTDPAYVHEYENYQKYIRCTFSRGDKAVYAVEKVLQNSIMVFSGYDITGTPLGVQKSEVYLWYPIPDTHEYITTLKLVNPMASAFSRAFVLEPLLISKRMRSEAEGYAYSKEDTQMTKQSIATFLRSYNVRFSMNGVDLLNGDREDQTALFRMATTIYFTCFRERHAQSVAAGMSIKTELAERAIGQMPFIPAMCCWLYVKTVIAWEKKWWTSWIGGFLRSVAGMPSTSGFSDSFKEEIYDMLPEIRGMQRLGVFYKSPYICMADVYEAEHTKYVSSLPSGQELMVDNAERIVSNMETELTVVKETLSTLAQYANDDAMKSKYLLAIKYMDEQISGDKRNMPNGVEATQSDKYVNSMAEIMSSSSEACSEVGDAEEIGEEDFEGNDEEWEVRPEGEADNLPLKVSSTFVEQKVQPETESIPAETTAGRTDHEDLWECQCPAHKGVNDLPSVALCRAGEPYNGDSEVFCCRCNNENEEARNVEEPAFDENADEGDAVFFDCAEGDTEGVDDTAGQEDVDSGSASEDGQAAEVRLTEDNTEGILEDDAKKSAEEMDITNVIPKSGVNDLSKEPALAEKLIADIATAMNTQIGVSNKTLHTEYMAFREQNTEPVYIKPEQVHRPEDNPTMKNRRGVVPPMQRKNLCLVRCISDALGITAEQLWKTYAMDISYELACKISVASPLWTANDIAKIARLFSCMVQIVVFELNSNTQELVEINRYVTGKGPLIRIYHGPGHWFTKEVGIGQWKLPEHFKDKPCGLPKRKVVASSSMPALLKKINSAAVKKDKKKEERKDKGADSSLSLPLTLKPMVLEGTFNADESKVFTKAALASVDEWIRYMQAEHKACVDMHRAVYASMKMAGRALEQVRKLYRVQDDKFEVYQRVSMHVYKCKDVSLVGTHVYSNEECEIYPIEKISGQANRFRCLVGSDEVMGSTGLFYYYNRAMYSAAAPLTPTVFDARRKYCMYQGVGGCGKSYTIKQRVKAEDIVICHTSSGAQALKEGLKGKINEGRVRTIDSFVINCAGHMFCDVLHIDEAVAAHPGLLVLVAELSKARQIWFYGDKAQNNFISRVAGFKLSGWWPPLTLNERNMVTWRSPMDVVVGMRDEPVYGNEYKTRSKVLRSVSTHAIVSVADVPQYWESQPEDDLKKNGKKSVLWMTWTQADKKVLLARGYKSVRTIAETQAKEADVSILVRLDPMGKGVPYEDMHQRNVAMGRHKHELHYYYVQGNQDLVHKTIARIQAIKDIEAVHGVIENTVASKEYPKVLESANLIGGKIPDAVSLRDPLHAIQRCYDLTTDNVSTISTEYDNYNIEMGDLSVNTVMSGRLKGDKVPVAPKPRKSFRPNLRTVCAPLRESSFRQGMLALNKRNLQVSTISLPTVEKLLVRDALDTAYKVLFRPDWRNVLREFNTHASSVAGSDMIRAYLNTQPEHVIIKAMAAGFEENDVEISNFEYIVKRQVKPSLDAKAGKEYEAPQTVMFNKKNVNVLYGGIMRELVERVKCVLKPNVLLNTRKSLDGIEEAIGECVHDLTTCTSLENDFSKYDKSQQRLVRLLEDTMMMDFSMPIDAVKAWSKGHIMSRNVGYAIGVSVYLLYQRKSGDASTSSGNTLVGMVMVVYCYGLTSFVYAMFLGDDSCIFVNWREVDEERLAQGPKLLAEVFNMSSKLDIKDIGYFCGYFILQDSSGVNRLVRDPLRAAFRLGRWDLLDEEGIEEYHISFKDSLRNYEDEILHYKVAMAAQKHYICAKKAPLQLLTRSLLRLKEDYKEFRRMWESTLSTTTY